MKNPLFYIPLHVDEMHATTAHLNLQEDGALNRLWRILWNAPERSIPDDDTWIRRKMMVGVVEFEEVVRPVIDEFLQRRNGRLFSPRLSEIYNEKLETSRKHSEAGRKGAAAKYLKIVD